MKSYITIKCTVTGIKFTPGRYLCKNNIELQNRFAEHIAKLIQQDLVRTIETQRYSSRWAPLSPSYLEYKKANGLSTKIWKASGNMVSSIYKIRRRSTILIGVSNSRKYPNSNQTLAEVAKRLEYGTEKVPARPLFRPIYSNYRKNIRTYWNKFLKTNS